MTAFSTDAMWSVHFPHLLLDEIIQKTQHERPFVHFSFNIDRPAHVAVTFSRFVQAAAIGVWAGFKPRKRLAFSHRVMIFTQKVACLGK